MERKVMLKTGWIFGKPLLPNPSHLNNMELAKYPRMSFN